MTSGDLMQYLRETSLCVCESWLHWFATSFGTTHGVVYASCKCMPLRHGKTDVFVSALRVLSALLRKHEW